MSGLCGVGRALGASLAAGSAMCDVPCCTVRRQRRDGSGAASTCNRQIHNPHNTHKKERDARALEFGAGTAACVCYA